MKLPVITTPIILLSLIPLSAVAQDIGYIDLTDNIFRERSRQPQTMGGGCGGSPHSTPDPRSQVTVTVVSLDKPRYRIGEEVTFEIKVMNSGKETIVVPWTPHLGDLEPADTRSSYKYRVGVVLLEFRDPEGIEFPVWESLYGSRKALSSSTPCRFIPAQINRHPTHNRCERERCSHQLCCILRLR